MRKQLFTLLIAVLRASGLSTLKCHALAPVSTEPAIVPPLIKRWIRFHQLLLLKYRGFHFGGRNLDKTSKMFFGCLAIFAIFAFSILPSGLGQSASVGPEIGIFYYVWYDANSEESWDNSMIVDTPILGFYDSSNSTVIGQHLSWIEALGIDFVIVSWWGNCDDFGRFTDLAAKQVFETARYTNSNLKFAIMVEPYPLDSDSYNYAEIYSHIHDTFVTPYPSLYYIDPQPVICFYNDPGHYPSLTDNGAIPLDERFNTILVGQEPYTQWIYTDLISGGSRPNQVSVTPRYDESRLPDRPGRVRIDVRLNQGVYGMEWNRAIQLWHEGKINTVLISTWNEFYERTAIEPHFDATAANKDPYLLYVRTKYFIEQIHKPFSSPSPSQTSSLNTLTSTSPSPTHLPYTPTTSTIPEFPYSLVATAIVFLATTALCAKLRKQVQKPKTQT